MAKATRTSKAAGEIQAEFKLGAAGMSVDELKTRINALDAESASLKRVLRGKLGGLARAGLPRTRKVSDAAIWATFDDEMEQSGKRGAVRRTARIFDLATKTIQRALKRRK